jgi:hypothetical protein
MGSALSVTPFSSCTFMDKPLKDYAIMPTRSIQPKGEKFYGINFEVKEEIVT